MPPRVATQKLRLIMGGISKKKTDKMTCPQMQKALVDYIFNDAAPLVTFTSKTSKTHKKDKKDKKDKKNKGKHTKKEIRKAFCENQERSNLRDFAQYLNCDKSWSKDDVAEHLTKAKFKACMTKLYKRGSKEGTRKQKEYQKDAMDLAKVLLKDVETIKLHTSKEAQAKTGQEHFNKLVALIAERYI